MRPVSFFTDPEITKLCNELWELDAKLCNARQLAQLKMGLRRADEKCIALFSHDRALAVGQMAIASNSSETDPFPEKSD
jgi:hypothetical protein